MRTRRRDGGAGRGIVAFRGGAPVIEAEFVVLARSGRTAPVSSAVAALPPPLALGLDALRPATPEPRPRAFSERGGAMFWVLGLWAVALAFWTAGGHALVVGVGAPPAIETLPFRVEGRGGNAVLVVEGSVRNPGPVARVLPPVAIRVGTKRGESLVHVLAAGPEPVRPGARRRFASRLPLPPGGVREARAFLTQ